MIKLILFYAGFLLFIALFSEEFLRAVQWVRAYLKQNPRSKFIAYPLIVLLAVVAGVIIVISLIRFSTTATFSYE